MLAGAAIVCALGGCAGSGAGERRLASKTPAQVLAAAKAAALGAATVHVSGSIVNEGKPISLDMELVSGQGGRGQVSLGNLSVRLIDLDKTVYLDGSAAFYRHFVGARAARRLPGRWLVAPAGRGALSSLASLTNMRKLLALALSGHGALSRVRSTTVGGRPAVAVSDGARRGTLYVSATGTPYPIEITRRGAGAGSISFARWNKPITLNPPKRAIAVEQLSGAR